MQMIKVKFEKYLGLRNVLAHMSDEREAAQQNHQTLCRELGIPEDSSFTLIIEVLHNCYDLLLKNQQERAQICSNLGIPIDSNTKAINDAIAVLNKTTLS